MWRANYARHSRPTYDALRGLLALPGTDELQPEQAYLLGATALDCSIMLTFQEVKIDCESDGGADQDLTAKKAAAANKPQDTRHGALPVALTVVRMRAVPGWLYGNMWN
ncbi:GL17057 [Drosophila persimilis]|uniref:Inositol-pentakisphosphate 2-kinase n=1 Tax=Drosophila persimilis TaxID=7234 RepID=B4GGW4_DROPE|nr:GL17057 [Drosophila persimilis]